MFKKIDRIPTDLNISEEDYIILVHMHLKHEWLNYEPSALLELWQAAGNDISKKELLRFLIDKFFFVDENKLNIGCLKIANTIENKWGLKPEDTLLVATCDNTKPDGSQQLLQALKNKFTKNEWPEENFSNSLTNHFNQYVCIESDTFSYKWTRFSTWICNCFHKSKNTEQFEMKVQNQNKIEQLSKTKTVVLIDDFIGTGITINYHYNYVINKLKNSSIKSIEDIRVISLARMRQSVDELDKLDALYYSSFELGKAIQELAPQNKREIYQKAMEEFELDFAKRRLKDGRISFGFKRSESLYAYGNNNIPNNVFPLFWLKHIKNSPTFRKTIFKRLY